MRKSILQFNRHICFHSSHIDDFVAQVQFVILWFIFTTPTKGLREQLRDGENIVIAEGYLWEIEKRGLAQFGSKIPVVVLEKLDEIEILHEENFALAGSDVIKAFTVTQ